MSDSAISRLNDSILIARNFRKVTVFCMGAGLDPFALKTIAKWSFTIFSEPSYSPESVT